jgi:alpha-L-rhamnosidase
MKSLLCALALLTPAVLPSKDQSADSGNALHLGLNEPARLSVTKLRCEYRVNPAGMDVAQPRLSWILRGDRRGEGQGAYQVLVARTRAALQRNEGDLWDSGRVESDQSMHVVYQGKPLTSALHCFWKVRVWDQHDRPSPWSEPAWWTMGLLSRRDWKARWIAAAHIGVGALPAAMLRRPFRLDGRVRRATAYAAALGLYELRINGRRVGDQLLAPEWTSYRKRVQYQTYDVTSLLHPGQNVAAAWLSEGWYAGRLMVVGRSAYGAEPRFLLQIEIEFADGRQQTIATDESWESWTDGPIRSASIYDGEEYDARKELRGWDAPGFDARGWLRVKAFELGEAQLVWQPNEPIRVASELRASKVTVPKPGLYVFDLGQNMVGWCRLKARGIAGQTVTMRHGEMLNEDGTLYTANLRGALQIDRYTPRVDGAFVFEPRFTYHGFRYVEVSGLAGSASTDALVGRVFHSSSPESGNFECSDPSLTQLMRNILWTQRANLMSSPNDCPQRDERFGWMGDIQVFSQTAIFNMDLAAFFTKWLRDIRDDQADDGRFPDFAPHPGNPNAQFSGAPAWADAGVIVPWRAYQNYADVRLLEEHFQSACRWVDWVHGMNPDLIWSRGRNNDYNDWLNGDWIKQAGWPAKGASVPNELFATAFFARSTELVARMARVLGLPDAAERYTALAERIKTAFNRAFVDKDGRLLGDTQGGYALALAFDLLPPELRSAATRRAVAGIRGYSGHLSTGIQTTHLLMLELARNGQHDLAWQLLTNRTFPSWRYMIDQGATTIWERWDGYVRGRGFQDPGMNSFNHWAFGAVGEWMWRHIAGLNPDDAQPGWRHFFIAPRPGGGVTWAKGEYLSVRGLIATRWRVGNGSFTLEVRIPPNTSATVRVPTNAPDQVREGRRPASRSPGVLFTSSDSEAAVFEVLSGRYVFQAPYSGPGSFPHQPAGGDGKAP